MADTLKSFLISYGFAIDGSSKAKAEAGVARTEKKISDTTRAESEKRVKQVKKEDDDRDRRAKDAEERFRKRNERTVRGLQGVASTAAKTGLRITEIFTGLQLSAVGIAYAVDKAARSFERLNYVSARAGTTATGVTAFGYASSQLGSTAEAGQAQLQSFGQLLRQPGYRQALQKLLGKRIVDAKGNLTESTEDLAVDLGDRLRRMQSEGQNGYARAMGTAQMYSFEGQQALTLMDPQFRAMEAQRRAQMGMIGADPNAAAASGTAFEQSMRHFTSVVDDIGTKIETVLAEKLRPQLDALAEWATKNGAQIADFVAKVASGIVDLAAAFAKSKTVQDGLAGLSGLLEDFSKYLTSDQFRKDLKAFAQDVVALGQAIHKALQMIGLVPTEAQPPVVPEPQGSGGGGASGGWVRSSLEHAAFRGRRDVPDAARARAKEVRRQWNEPAAPFSAGEFRKETGASEGEYAAMRDGIAQIEGAKYGQMGGSSGRFAGRYQMGAGEISEVARSFGEATPTQQQFLADPALQERYFERYTLRHYRQLMHTPEFQRLPLKQRLEVLGYAHNQGVGGAIQHLRSGVEGRDAFGTGGSAYIDVIHRRISGRLQELPALRAPRPLGDTPALHTSIANTRGETHQSLNNTFNIHAPVDQALRASRMMAGRGWQDVLRNAQGQEQ